MTQIQATPMLTESPEKMDGIAPGKTTCTSTCHRFAPSVRAASVHTGGSVFIAWIVATVIGKNAAKAVMNTIPCSPVGKSRMAIGTSAMAGTGRATSIRGRTSAAVVFDRPMAIPTSTPTAPASAKPVRIRPRLARTCR